MRYEVKKMTTAEIIHDLKVLKDSFEEHTNGCSPICLEEAIKIIEEMKGGEENDI